jgi:hypothetical protein
MQCRNHAGEAHLGVQVGHRVTGHLVDQLAGLADDLACLVLLPLVRTRRGTPRRVRRRRHDRVSQRQRHPAHRRIAGSPSGGSVGCGRSVDADH